MVRKIEEPTVTKDGDREVWRHPAYAQISVHHVQGRRVLYGSDFEHGGFIRITVSASELNRNLSHDWYFEKKTLFEVDMSHAQYVAMIGAPNTMGQPCTLSYVQGERIPEFPVRDSKTSYPAEVDERLKKAIGVLEDLKKQLIETGKGLTKAKAAALIKPVDNAIMQIMSNVPFVMGSFGKHMETTVERARVEVHAYVNNVLVKAGLEKLQGDIKLLESKCGHQDCEEES